MLIIRLLRRASATLALAALAVSLAPLPGAVARADDGTTVAITTGAGADWGVKSSFRSYVVGSIAHGAIAVADGASTNPDGSFHFPVAGGEYDPATGATVVRFGGSVRFTGHGGQLDMTIRDPRVELTADGSDLYADVASKSLDSGAPLLQYPNVRLAQLDSASATPLVDASSTTWPALPATLTPEAVAPFAGFYAAGTPLDGFAFGYDSTGGKPQSEQWTPPGTPLFGTTAGAAAPAGSASMRLAFDPGRDRVWLSGRDEQALYAFDDETLALGATVPVGDSIRSVRVDRASGTLYTLATGLRAIVPAGSGFSVGSPFHDFGTGVDTLAVRQSDGATFVVTPGVLHQFTPDGTGAGGFTHVEHPIDTGYRQVKVSESDRVYVGGDSAGAAQIAEVTFDGASAALTPVPDTSSAGEFAVAADGTIAFVVIDTAQAPLISSVLHVLRPRAGGGWDAQQVAGGATVFFPNAIAISQDGSRVYAASSTQRDVLVFEDGAIAGRVSGPAPIADLATAPDGTPYVAYATGAFARIGVTGSSPTIDAQPQDATVRMNAAGDPQNMTFAVAATGTPAPAVRWQMRAPGSARWVDVVGASTARATIAAGATRAAGAGAADAGGATDATLTVSATLALNGARYRAIAENAAGALASQFAALTVAAAEPVPDGGGTPGPDTPGTDPPAPPVQSVPAPDAGPPGPPNPPPVARATQRGGRTAAPIATIAAPRALQRVGRTRVMTVASVTCRVRSGACRVLVPRQLTVRVAGQRYRAQVLSPTRIAAGRRATVRVRLPRAAVARLARSRTRVMLTARVTVTSGTKRVTRTVRARLAGARTSVRVT